MFGNPYYAPYQYPYNAQNDVYKQQFQQPMQTNAQTQQMPQTANMGVKNDMLWVLNKNEADSYPVAPNCSVVLWDKNAPTIYVKSMSANGVPSMRTLDFKERVETAQNSSVTNEKGLDDKFATLDQFKALQGEIDGLRAKLENITIETVEEKPKTTAKKSKGGDE